MQRHLSSTQGQEVSEEDEEEEEDDSEEALALTRSDENVEACILSAQSSIFFWPSLDSARYHATWRWTAAAHHSLQLCSQEARGAATSTECMNVGSGGEPEEVRGQEIPCIQFVH